MNNSKFIAVLVAMVIAMGAFIAWQYQFVQRLRAENHQLKTVATEAEHLRDENHRLTMSQSDATELEKLRKEQSELLRLRDELARLRRQLKEAAATRPPPAKTVAPPPASAPETPQPLSPVNTYQASIRAALAPGQTLVTGGWVTAEGKRTFVLIQPEVSDNNQITVQSRFVELPEEAVAKAGLDPLKVEDKQSAAKAILSEDQARQALAFFEATQDVNVLATPKVSTLTGRQAQIKSVNLKTIGGETYEMGPTVDVIPYLSADQSTVEMTVIATLRQLATPER